VIGIRITEQRGEVAAAFMVNDGDEVFLVASGGVIIRIPVSEISVQGRDATGVRVMNLDDGQYVAAAALVQERDDENGDAATNGDIAPAGTDDVIDVEIVDDDDTDTDTDTDDVADDDIDTASDVDDDGAGPESA
jgi:DNA gyrase subunit A